MDLNNANATNVMQQFAAFLPFMQLMQQQQQSGTQPPANPAHTQTTASDQTSSDVLSSQSAQAPMQVSSVPSSMPQMPTLPQMLAAVPPPAVPAPPAAQAQPLPSPSAPGSMPPSASSMGTPGSSQVVVAPPVTPYTSIQMLGAVAGSSHPFPSLVQRVNRDRQEHAHDTLPKNRKPRGKAQRPPSLFSHQPALRIEDCLALAAEGIHVVNLEVWIHPAQPSSADRKSLDLPRNMYRYSRNEESYRIVLEALHLLHTFPNLPVTTKVVELVEHLSRLLSSKGFTFPSDGVSGGFAAHESLPLQLLSYTNLGRPNGSNKTPRLVSAAYRAETNLSDLLGNLREYAIAKWSVTDKKYFIIHLCIRSPDTEIMVNLKELHLGPDNVTQNHRCVHKRIYSIFRNDMDARIGEGFGFLNEALMEAGCDIDGDSEGEEDIVVAQMLTTIVEPRVSPAPSSVISSLPPTPRSSSRISSASSIRAPSSRISSSSSTREHSSRISSISSTRSISVDSTGIDSSLGGGLKLWTEPEIRHGLDDDLGILSDRSSIIFNAVQNYFELQTDDPMPGLSIEGEYVGELARELKKHIIDCLVKKDFSSLLNPDRHFIQCEMDASGASAGYYITSGPGLEREVMQHLAREYLEKRNSEFLVPRLGNYSTLATIPAESAILMSDTKRQDLGVLGAIIGLSLIHGHAIDPINPLLLVYILEDCNLGALNKGLVSHWFPELFRDLSMWNSMGPDDAIPIELQTHLAAFHDMQPSALAGRNEEMHKQFAWQMLHSAVVGPQSIKHPYFEAFMAGLLLPCVNGSMNLGRIARAFVGGPKDFVCSVYACKIVGYSSLNLRFTKVVSEETKWKLSQALRANSHYQTLHTVEAVFKDFLETKGIPCRDRLNSIKERFDASINLEDAESEGSGSSTFRARMFCWAATGVPFALLDSIKTEIRLIDESDETYTENPNHRTGLLNAGVCKFKTCSRLMFLPAAHLLQLLEASYDPNSDPKDARAAIHHWLLVSILDSIGKNNVN